MALDVLELGKPIEVVVIDEIPVEGRHGRGTYVAGRMFATTTVWDHVFATPEGALLLGNRQDSSDIEIMNVSVDARDRLQPSNSFRVAVIPPEGDGYRARMVEGALALYFVHQPFYEDRGQRVHALPGLQDTGGLQRLRARDVYRPLLHTSEPALHVMLRCAVSDLPVNCASHALLGKSAGLYMGSDAAYLWLVAEPHAESATSAIARLPYDGSAPTAVRIDGTRPASVHEVMKESGDSLYVVSARRGASELSHVRIPKSQFAESAPYVADMRDRPLREAVPGQPPVRVRPDVAAPADDSLSLVEGIVLIRREDQLIVQQLSPERRELQRLSLSPSTAPALRE